MHFVHKLHLLLSPDAFHLVVSLPRYAVMQKFLTGIDKNEGGMDRFTKSYQRYGLRRMENGVMCREWCPGASAVFIFGDFSRYLSICCNTLGVLNLTGY